MKVELYYNKENDCVQMVQDGVLKTSDSYIESCEFLSYFNIDEVEGFKTLTGEQIVEGFHDLMGDFQYHSPSEVDDYLQKVKEAKIEGELITTKFITN